MGPRANFVCLSRKCQQDGAASTYELPVTATRCAVCGSKRIRRLYDVAPAVMKSGARQLQRFVDDAGSEAQAKVTAGRDARLAAEKAGAPMFAVPIKQLGAALGQYGIQANVQMAGSRPTVAPAMPLMSELRRMPPRPGPDSRADRARITTDGKVVEGAA
jgi:hypothetical protein